MALLVQAVDTCSVQDFENTEQIPEETPISTLGVGGFKVEVLCACGSTPFEPYTAASPEFNAEGKIYNLVLIAGTSMTLMPHPEQVVGALGTWIFDDGGALDSAYLVRVTELDGKIWQAVLENEIPLGAHNHEIEGFIGAVSDVGIAELTVTAIDPDTGEAHADSFEIDHLIVAGPPVNDENTTTASGDTGDDDQDDDTGGDDLDEDSRHDGDPWKNKARRRHARRNARSHDWPSHIKPIDFAGPEHPRVPRDPDGQSPKPGSALKRDRPRHRPR
ncbi:MAG: hypothetical protein JXQ75_19030 [Phycisphaerae bacterium]|nr:hypothetical protein [Phycisphaerae bacterium]